MENVQINSNQIINNTKVKLDILQTITNLQNQNGVRMNDYLRYSKYCRKKINKLRKIFKLTQGKKKFIKVDINAENVTDPKILLIAILDTERRWAVGMQMKQTLTNKGEDIKKIRYNIKKKFKRAVEEAKELVITCNAVADNQTNSEAEAYLSMMESNSLIFSRKFNEAYEKLKNTIRMYEILARSKDNIESIVYEDKITVLKSSVRLCQYNIKVFLL